MRRAEISRKFDDIVGFAEVEKFINTPVKHYSSGMYVRLAFAVAAYLDQDILFVDEVLAVGDAEFQRRCINKMKDISSAGRTVLFVSHNATALRNLCSSGLLLDNGALVKGGAIDDVLSAYVGSTPNVSTEIRRAQIDRSWDQCIASACLRSSGWRSAGRTDTGYCPVLYRHRSGSVICRPYRGISKMLQ